MINTLQAGRFLAAMAVVLHHAVISTAAFVDAPPPFIQSTLHYGYFGVDFFFVLSGFIIHYTMNARSRPAARFAIDRLRRIMLPYWPVGIMLAIAYTLLPGLSAGDRDWGWVSTLTLIPTGQPPALSVAWTLQHELVFYLIYALLLYSGRIWIGLVIWAVAIAASYLLGPADWPLLQVVLAPINVEFIAGVAAAALFLSSRPVSAIGSLALAAGFLALFISVGGDRNESWLVGFAMGALLPWICRVEHDGVFLIPRWFIFGGAASYAIYLVHNPLLSVLSRLIAQTELGWGPALLLSTAICAAAGMTWYLVWERPIMQLIK